MKRLAVLATLFAIFSAGTTQAFSDNRPPDGNSVDQAVFGFAGAMTKRDMFYSANPFGVDYEKQAVLGLGYQMFPYKLGKVRMGLEVGVAGRFSARRSAEMWTGGVIRYDQFIVGNTLHISPSFTAGLSRVTRSHGREREQEVRYRGNARNQFYLGPEISASLKRDAQVEVFWRLHHRSGAGKTLGNMKGASNANVLGIRYKF